MTHLLQRPLALVVLALACSFASPVAAQDEIEGMRKRALAAAISAMDLANDPSSDIQYDGQPGSGVLQGLLNPRYFTLEADYHFVLKDGMSPSRAITAIFRGPTRLECNTMMIAIEYRAIKAAIGAHRFSRAFAPPRSIRIEIAAATADRVLGPWLKSVPDPKADDLVVGDWVYFANHDEYLYKHPAGAWQGENALYVGDNANGEKLYSGFGVSQVTEDEMLMELLRAYNAPRSAEDEARAWQEMPDEDQKRVGWVKANSIVGAADEDEAVAIIEDALGLTSDSFEHDVIEETAGSVLVAVEYTPPTEDYPETVTLDDMRGLIQCLRLDMESLLDLGKSPPTTSAVSGMGGALGGAFGN
jgi:hypothetical protein